MPHILVQGTDINKNIETLIIHADVKFSRDYYTSPKSGVKLKELQEKIERLVQEYFPDYESETLSNHAYNMFFKSF